MTIFAAIATKNNTTNTTNAIVGFGASKAACSRAANRNTKDAYGNRSKLFGEINICEFESLADAREYVARMPAPK